MGDNLASISSASARGTRECQLIDKPEIFDLDSHDVSEGRCVTLIMLVIGFVSSSSLFVRNDDEKKQELDWGF